MTESKMLLIDCCNNGGMEINLNESNIEKGLIKFKGKFQEAEAVNKNKRLYPYVVLDENVQRLNEVVKSRGLVGELDHPCLTDDNFEVLTTKGWRHFREIHPGDYIFSLVNGQAIHSKVNGIVNEPYDGQVYRVKGRNIDCTFTPAHKVVLHDRNKKECYVRIDEIHRNPNKYAYHSIPMDCTFVERGFDKKAVPCLHISHTNSTSLRLLKTIEIHHTGRIYCLQTEHGNFYMRYRGKSFWTGNSDSIIHFKEASHVITKLWWEGNVLMGEGEILNTAHGRQLKALLSDGVRVGISSRGVGNGKVNENGILVIGESYKLITFDAVADPSTFAAFQEKVTSKRENNINNVNNQNSNNNSNKNEDKSIHNISKDAVIAALGGIFREETNKFKARLTDEQ